MESYREGFFVGCRSSRVGCLKSGTSLYDDSTLIGYPTYQKTSRPCPSTILASHSNSLATKAFIKSYELTSNRLAKKLHPPYPETNKSRTLSKHSGNAPVEKRWTNQVLPLKGLPITRIPACQSGSSAPRLGTSGKRMAKRHKYGTFFAWIGGVPGTWGRSQ